MVDALKKPGTDILRSLTPEKVDLWHAVTGIVTEAGELMDAVKKHIIYNKELDIANVVEELGDLEFYMEQLRQNCQIIRSVVLALNMQKLAQRYDGHYSDGAARARVDKK